MDVYVAPAGSLRHVAARSAAIGVAIPFMVTIHVRGIRGDSGRGYSLASSSASPTAAATARVHATASCSVIASPLKR